MAPAVGGELAARGGIGICYGCHCAHLLVKHIVHVGPRLEIFQRGIVTLFPRLSLPGVARASLGLENTADDVDTLLRVLGQIAGAPKAKVAKSMRRQMDDFAGAAARRVYAGQ
jgi:selenocysteine lyase/cysteine desulfurase